MIFFKLIQASLMTFFETIHVKLQMRQLCLKLGHMPRLRTGVSLYNMLVHHAIYRMVLQKVANWFIQSRPERCQL